jgi:hypothetical protein
VRIRLAGGERQFRIAQSLNVSRSTIWLIAHNRSWRSVR